MDDPSLSPETPPASAFQEDFETDGDLKGLARRLVLDESAADDVVQEVWLTVLQRPPAHLENPPGWLRAVTRSLALRRLRVDRNRESRERRAARAEAVDGPEPLVDRAAARRQLRRAVADLREPFAEIIRLHYLEEIPVPELAERRGCPESTIRTQIRRGLEALRSRLEREYDDGRALGLGLIYAFDWGIEDLPRQLAARATVGGGARTSSGWANPRIAGAALTGLLLVTWAIWPAAPAPETEVVELEPAAPAGRPSLDTPREEPVREAVAAAPPEEPEPAPVAAPFGQPVQVVDLHGRPVEGAEILVTTDVSRIDSEVRATTDSQGRAIVPLDGGDGFRLYDRDPRAPVMSLHARAQGHALSDEVYLPSVTEEPLSLRVGGPDLIVHGRVEDPSGEPVEGVRIYIQEISSPLEAHEDGTRRGPAKGRALSGADGSYRVAGLAARQYQVIGYKERWAVVRGNVDTRHAPEVRHDLVIRRGGVLYGRVFGVDGLPSVGACVYVDAVASDFVTVDYANEEGRYELFGVEIGPNRISAFTRASPDGRIQEEARLGSWGELYWSTADGEELQHDFHLRTDQRASVRVVDTSGAPVPNVPVYFASEATTPRWSRPSVTDRDGRAEVMGAPAEGFRADVTDFDRRRTIARLDWAEPDGVEREVVYRASDVATLRGTCVRPDGTPWGRGYVNVREMETDHWAFAQLDPETGAFVATLGAGRQMIELAVEGLGTTRVATATLSPGEDLDLGVLRGPEPGRLELDWSFEGDPSSYRYLVRSFFVGRGHDLVIEGSGAPPPALDILPGACAVYIDRGDERVLERRLVIRSGRTHRQSLSENAPVVGSFLLRAPPEGEDRTARVVLTRLPEGARDPLGDTAPIAERCAALVDLGGEEVENVVVERGSDGCFSLDLDLTEGVWSVIAKTPGGRVYCEVIELGPGGDRFEREVELVLPE